MYFTLSTYKQSSEGKGCVQVSQDVKGQEPLEPSHPAQQFQSPSITAVPGAMCRLPHLLFCMDKCIYEHLGAHFMFYVFYNWVLYLYFVIYLQVCTIQIFLLFPAFGYY